jgi:hypothetical protein
MYSLSSLRRQLRDHKVLVALATLFATGVGSGYALGSAWSPDFEDPTSGPRAIQQLIARDAVEVEPLQFNKRYDANGRLVFFRKADGVLRYVCGIASFDYDLEAGTVHRGVASGPGRGELLKRKGIHLDQVTAVIAGGGAGTFALGKTLPGFVRQLQEQTKTAEKVQLLAFGVAAIGSGVALGFWWAYEAEPGCGSPAFQKALQDPVSWAGIARGRDAVWTFAWERIPGTVGPPVEHGYRITVDVPEASENGARVVPPESCQVYGTDRGGNSWGSSIAFDSVSTTNVEEWIRQAHSSSGIRNTFVPADRLSERECVVWTAYFFARERHVRGVDPDSFKPYAHDEPLKPLVLQLLVAKEYDLATRFNRLLERDALEGKGFRSRPAAQPIDVSRLPLEPPDLLGSEDEPLAIRALLAPPRAPSDDLNFLPRPPWSR